MIKIKTFNNDKISLSMMKTIYQEQIIIIIYVCNNTASKYKNKN